jgi:hypothetical protein
MGVQTMSKQSGNKVTKTDTINKSKQPTAATANVVKDELSEQELDKASGGAIDAYIYFKDQKGIR